MKPKVIKLSDGERVIAVVPKFYAGPGWANAVAEVYIETADHKLRVESIQPGERTQELTTLFAIGAQVCAALEKAVPQARARRRAE